MNSLAIIIGLAAVLGGGYLGYVISKMRNSQNPDMRRMGIFLIILMTLSGVFLQSISDNKDSDQALSGASSIRIPQTINLHIGEPIHRTLSIGDSALLMYSGESGEVVTLRVSAPQENQPVITVLLTATGESRPVTVHSSLQSRVPSTLCGYRLPENGRYAFGFEARVSGDYTITFERGDTCQRDS